MVSLVYRHDLGEKLGQLGRHGGHGGGHPKDPQKNQTLVGEISFNPVMRLRPFFQLV